MLDKESPSKQSVLPDIKPTPKQREVLGELMKFVSSESDRVFILKGYAGTGKTTLMRFLVKELGKRGVKFRLLASTGRAAKVLSNLTARNGDTSTIHSMVYSFSGLNKDLSDKVNPTADETGQLLLKFEAAGIDEESTPETIYIVDEASMVSDMAPYNATQAEFGSGRLLKDLLDYDRRRMSKYIFVGDPCQLPPIQQYFSPALMANYFGRTFHMEAQVAELTDILRQDDASSIIKVSKQIREFYALSPEDERSYLRTSWGKMPFRGHSDIVIHPSDPEMLEEYAGHVRRNGIEKAICICYSNKRALNISLWVRQQLNRPASHLAVGDILQVVQNNYGTGLMNGDFVVVEELMGSERNVANIKFSKVKVRELYSNRTCVTLLMEDLLYQPRPNLDEKQQTDLFINFIGRMKRRGVTQKDKKIFNDAMMVDPYLNALRCVFGYAITCHKAQGGEWDDVYIDFPRNITRNPTKGKWQWVYTAITRAKERLHVKDDFYFN